MQGAGKGCSYLLYFIVEANFPNAENIGVQIQGRDEINEVEMSSFMLLTG